MDDYENKITFIIPSIGRDTLNRTINSLLNQNIEDWYAIIVFDGIKSNLHDLCDNRIQIIEIEKCGNGINSSGLVRNEGIKYVKTNWIAFLDDDDTIAHDYIDKFYEELNNNIIYDIDVLIFRMVIKDNENKIRIIPKQITNNFYLCDVGISFIIKREIIDNNILFIPDGAEDFVYLDMIRKAGYKILISKYIKYFVRNEPYIIYKYCNSVFINVSNKIISFIGYSLI